MGSTHLYRNTQKSEIPYPNPNRYPNTHPYPKPYKLTMSEILNLVINLRPVIPCHRISGGANQTKLVKEGINKAILEGLVTK
ncbi:hypothetical protein YC2023_024065 [Brassica napus]